MNLLIATKKTILIAAVAFLTLSFAKAQTVNVSCTGNNVLCNGSNSGSASATPSGGTLPYSYSWNTGATTSVITGLNAGIYSLTATDFNGSSTTCSVSINEPPALTLLLAIDSLFCPQLAVSGGTSPYRYLWTGPNGFTSNLAQLNCQGAFSAGTYSVTVTDANGCTASQNIILLYPVFSASANSTFTLSYNSCDATITLNLTGSENYFYRINCTGPQISFSGSPEIITGVCPDVTSICVGDFNQSTVTSIPVIVVSPAALQGPLLANPCWKCEICVTEDDPKMQVSLGDDDCPLPNKCVDDIPLKVQLDVNNLAPGNTNAPIISITRDTVKHISGTVFRTFDASLTKAEVDWALINTRINSDFQIRNGGINSTCGETAIHINKSHFGQTGGGYFYGKNYVGIGTEDPQANLHIASPTGRNFLLRLERTDGQPNFLDFIMSTSPVGGSSTLGLGSYSLVLDNHRKIGANEFNSGDIAFSTNGKNGAIDGTIDMVIKSSANPSSSTKGYVGIGTTTPLERLDVEGHVRVRDLTGGPLFSIVAADNSAAPNGGTLGKIDLNNDPNYYLAGNGTFRQLPLGLGGGACGTPYRVTKADASGNFVECSQIYDNGLPFGGVGVGDIYSLIPFPFPNAATPINQFQVDGDARIGGTHLVASGLSNGSIGSLIAYDLTTDYGSRLHFSGGHNESNLDRDNTDPIWMSRYYYANDASQLRINIGNEINSQNNNLDLFNVGTSVAPNEFPGGESWVTHMVVASEGNTGIGGRLFPVGTSQTYAFSDVFNNINRPLRKLEVMSSDQDPNDPASTTDLHATNPAGVYPVVPFPQLRITSARSNNQGFGTYTDIGTNYSGDFFILPTNQSTLASKTLRYTGIGTEHPANTLTVGFDASANQILSGLRLNAMPNRFAGQTGNNDYVLAVNGNGDVYPKFLNYGHGNVSACANPGQQNFLPVLTSGDGKTICQSIVYDFDAVAHGVPVDPDPTHVRRIGIATTDPAAKLDVQNRDATTAATFSCGNFVIDRFSFSALNTLTTIPCALNAEFRTSSTPYTEIAGINSFIPGTNSAITHGVRSIITTANDVLNTEINGVYSIVNASSAAAGNTSSNYGVRSEVSGRGASQFGGFFSTDGGASNLNYGIFSEAPNAINSWAGWFQGNVCGAGNLVLSSSTLQFSDSTLKENIRPINNALSIINNLSPRLYDFKTSQYPDLNLSNGDQFGFISQEVEQVVPELVGEIQVPKRDSANNVISTATYKTLNYIGIIPIAVQAIQQLDSTVNQLSTSRVSTSCTLENNYLPKATGSGTLCNSRIYDNGVGVAIGTNVIPAGYGFIVDSLKAGFRELYVVCQDSVWPDYVFDSTHPLKPLDELENYVTTNKHLPGIPSALEIKNGGGINIGEMQAKQMEKIEELYKYIIEMNKNMGRLSDENKALKERMTILDKK